ncbi:HCP-like protein [Rhizoclosmatium globosum]|uniref:HCP-like protein n=1 Tax=Rhizoclosmatium globosum TaxID=329046 RepID=A0A1Y2CW63_9FUNG|nr:HCP-like protein [Rhizoclosmatium globosum]|eukprot:ORY51270.1 HCP-like protein [Rhizoclosmatium globosum]
MTISIAARTKTGENAAPPSAYSTAAIESQRKSMQDWVYEEAEVKAAIANIEGFFGSVSTGLKSLHELALGGNAEARDYLDPVRSTLNASKYPKTAHAFGDHFQQLGDHDSAMLWFKKGAEANYHESQVSYAAYLVTGKSVEYADPGQAIAYLMKAWDSGKNKEAALALVKLMRRVAWEQGRYPDAAYVVGFSYGTGVLPFSAAINPGDEDNSKGWNASGLTNMKVNETLAGKVGGVTEEENEAPVFVNPVPCDYVAAAKWYKLAAGLGHPRACNNLAELYMTGKGVEANDSTGFKYFQKASSAGLAEGHYNLGRCYYTARGCWENKKKAEELFRMAEKLGIAEATKSLEPFRAEVMKQRTGGWFGR